MRVQRTSPRATGRRAALGVLLLVGVLCCSGVALWSWTQAASVIALHGPLAGLSVQDAARATWRLLLDGGVEQPALAFPTRAQRQTVPGAWAYAATLILALAIFGVGGWRAIRLFRSWQTGSPLGKRRLARRALERGWIAPRTWAQASDLRGLWVPGSRSGRPYLGYTNGPLRRMLAAEREVQPMVVAPPRAGKSSGYVIPWLLEHNGPALVLSTKRDVYEATFERRSELGRVLLYDPFGPESASFTPLGPARSWSGALRVGEALASAAYGKHGSAANEFWDREAASLLAPLLHAAAIANASMTAVISWLDARQLREPIQTLRHAGAGRAAEQLIGVSRRDERNRETTVMSALSLLRAYRYPELASLGPQRITPRALLDGHANTVYVVAAGHDQAVLRPVMLALVTSVYETAVAVARRRGRLDPALWILMDEAANIAPVRELASWLSQCGDHGITIATIWQSLAQIDERYGRPARDAICAASTAQLFLPPLTDPTTSGYLSEILGEEPVANASGRNGGPQSMSATQQRAAPAPWLRQITPGRALLVYRHLAPAIVRAPRWFERSRTPAHPRQREGERRSLGDAQQRSSVLMQTKRGGGAARGG